MTKKEYIKRMNEDKEWAPGWEAIESEFARLYPGVKEAHYATALPARIGGNDFLDGFSVYTSDKGYQHIVTFGMSALYADEQRFGKEYSKWGYEMTMKLKEKTPNDCKWAMEVLLNLAGYTYKTDRYFDPFQCIPGNGSPLHIGTDSMITALITVDDTTAKAQKTPHGKLGFIQLVGITEQELNEIKKDIDVIPKLVKLMKKDNPELVTDMERNFSYL